jgi:acetoin utilization deacetylase AcuC-like enzyme
MTGETALRVYFSAAYTAARYSFDTTRKAGWVASSLRDEPVPGLMLAEPEPLTRRQLETVHSSGYIEAMRRGTPRWLATSSGLEWDEQLFHAACASNGGALAAAVEAFGTRLNTGSLSSGLHHSAARAGGGFCVFNGIAIAARALLAGGARQVLILDLDAHCGGGTYGLVRQRPGVVHLDISVSSVDRYEPETGPSTLDMVTDAGQYLPTLRARLSMLDALPFDVCLYNAGMDLHEECALGGLPGVTTELLAEREQMVFRWAAERCVPVAFVLAGGYTGPRLPRRQLVALHRLTVEAAAMWQGALSL